MKMNNIRLDKAALLAGGAVVAVQGAAKTADEEAPAGEGRRPNIVIIMTDQQRADLTSREGYPLDLTPFADSIAAQGCWFDRAYTPCPASGPARVSMLTGRFPKATGTDSNHNIADAFFYEDLFSTARKNGYLTALVGKNHSHLKPEDADFWCPYNHLGQEKMKWQADTLSEENRAFDRFLGSTDFYTSLTASPGDITNQIPYRMVSDALNWAGNHEDEPFVMWLSFPEPHNPYQVCEPYFSMFESLVPPALTDASDLAAKGEKFLQLNEMMKLGHKGYDLNLERLRTTYMGMIRMLDDQMRRFVEGMQDLGLYENTVFVITADHGDYAGEYGLMKKGAGVPDAITRIPMVWFGKDIEAAGLRGDHVSLVDIYPTACELMGCEIPLGVQGRSLAEMLAGRDYPEEEFRSIMTEAGFGGQYITKEDMSDYQAEGAVGRKGLFFDELNTWSQSGTIAMVRMGRYKLVYDMLGNGELYDLEKDPSEMRNLYGSRKYGKIKESLLEELLKWEIATEDPIPVPRNRYRFKRFEHNYLFTE